MHKAIRLRHNETRQDSIAHPLGASGRTASWRSSINRCTARYIHCHSDHFTFPEARFGAVIIPRLGVSSTGSSLIGSGLWWSRSAALPYRRTRVGRGRALRVLDQGRPNVEVALVEKRPAAVTVGADALGDSVCLVDLSHYRHASSRRRLRERCRGGTTDLADPLEEVDRGEPLIAPWEPK